MASKKERQRIKWYYERRDCEDRWEGPVTKKNAKNRIEAYEKKLKNSSFLFPEVNLETPLQLGMFYEATVQIGNDKPREKRIIGVSFITGTRIIEKAEGLKMFCRKYAKESVMYALPASQKSKMNAELRVLYPRVLDGWVMMPAWHFSWYGNEKVTITDVKRYRPRSEQFLCLLDTFGARRSALAGKLAGRQLEGVEILEREDLTVGD